MSPRKLFPGRLPRQFPKVDWNNPLTRNLKAVFVPVGAQMYEAVNSILTQTYANERYLRDTDLVPHMSNAATTAVFDTVFGMPATGPLTILATVYNRTSVAGGDHGAIIKVGDLSSGYGVGFGSGNFDTGGATVDVFGLYELVAWKTSSPTISIPLGGAWVTMAMYINSDASGSIYVPGVGTGTWGISGIIPPVNKVFLGGYSAGRFPLDDDFLIGALWDRTLTSVEVDSIKKNPGQLFLPEYREFFYVSSGAGSSISATPGTYSWGGPTAKFSATVQATPGTYSWGGPTAKFSTNIQASPGAYTWSALTSTFGTPSLSASVGAYSWGGTTSAVLFPITIAASYGVYTWSGRTATISGAAVIVSKIRSRFDSAPLQAELTSEDPRWRKWFQDVWDSVNARALPLPTAATLTASPHVYQFQRAGRGRLLVSGGTVSLVEWSRDGSNYFTIGSGQGAYPVVQNDFLRITYTVAPTLTQVLD